MANRWWQRPRTAEEEALVAHHELLINDSITVYTMVDGAEQRRSALSPIISLQRSAQQVTEAFNRFGESIAAVGEAMRRVTG